MNEADLDEIYAQWPTEKLVKAITLEADQYTAAAMPAMRRALDARGLSESALNALAAEIRADHDTELQRMSRIRGWLLVFILYVAGNSLFLLGIGYELAVTAPVRILRLEAVPAVVFGLYGLFCASILIAKRPEAPQRVRRLLVLEFFFGLVGAVLVFAMAVLQYFAAGSVSPDALTLTGAAILGLGVFVLWIIYLG